MDEAASVYDRYRQEQLRKKEEEAGSDDELGERRLPLGHRPTESVDWSVAERVTTETPIAEHNKGFEMMRKLGWSVGQGLGRTGEGRVEPVSIAAKDTLSGVGRDEEDEELVQQATRRRLLESEQVETEAERLDREDKLQRKEAIRKELDEVTSTFHCELCNKRYKKVTEYDAHLGSYDHGHTKRLKEMREAESARNRSKEEEQRKKEQLREQRSLNEQVQRTAAAAALSLAPSAAVASAVPDTPRQSISFGIKKAPPAAAAPKVLKRPALFDDDDDDT